MTVSFVIDRAGAVSEVRTKLNGALTLEIGRCVETIFRTITFDAPEGGSVTVEYPIFFSPTE